MKAKEDSARWMQSTDAPQAEGAAVSTLATASPQAAAAPELRAEDPGLVGKRLGSAPSRPGASPRARLSDQLADHLAAQLRAGVWQPGQPLPTEAELVRRHGVSRTVVREAVSRLSSLGLLESRQGSGVYVRSPAGIQPLDLQGGHAAPLQAVLQIVEVRRALEAEAAALAAERRSPAQLDAIAQALQAVDAAAACGRDGVEEDLRFHHLVAQATGNGQLMATLDYLMAFLREGTRVTRANEARRADMMAAVRREHRAILAAIERGDAAAARRAATRHMQHAEVRLAQADAGFWRAEGAALAEPLLRGIVDS
jgi:GntR family transcriptional regulator, transcriptional repressor for pyruvate dehydrogenase complex